MNGPGSARERKDWPPPGVVMSPPPPPEAPRPVLSCDLCHREEGSHHKPDCVFSWQTENVIAKAMVEKMRSFGYESVVVEYGDGGWRGMELVVARHKPCGAPLYERQAYCVCRGSGSVMEASQESAVGWSLVGCARCKVRVCGRSYCSNCGDRVTSFVPEEGRSGW